jgi:hypothetical protein
MPPTWHEKQIINRISAVLNANGVQDHMEQAKIIFNQMGLADSVEWLNSFEGKKPSSVFKNQAGDVVSSLAVSGGKKRKSKKSRKSKKRKSKKSRKSKKRKH